ncbi:hypothetical protein Trydic_g2326 [Trypoxylus dichotomus]
MLTEAVLLCKFVDAQLSSSADVPSLAPSFSPPPRPTLPPIYPLPIPYFIVAPFQDEGRFPFRSGLPASQSERDPAILNTSLCLLLNFYNQRLHEVTISTQNISRSTPNSNRIEIQTGRVKVPLFKPIDYGEIPAEIMPQEGTRSESGAVSIPSTTIKSDARRTERELNGRLLDRFPSSSRATLIDIIAVVGDAATE